MLAGFRFNRAAMFVPCPPPPVDVVQLYRDPTSTAPKEERELELVVERLRLPVDKRHRQTGAAGRGGAC